MIPLLAIIFLCLCQNVFADFNSGDIFGKGIIVQASGTTVTGGGRTLNFLTSGITVTNGVFNIPVGGGGGASVPGGTNLNVQYNNQGISLGGSNSFVFNPSTGNVGIGTFNPQGALTVTNGNIGVGTYIPTSALDVELPNWTGSTTSGINLNFNSVTAPEPDHTDSLSVTGATGQIMGMYINGVNARGIINGYRINGSLVSPSALLNNQEIFRESARGSSGTSLANLSASVASISYITSQNWNVNWEGTDIGFRTTANGTLGGGTVTTPPVVTWIKNSGGVIIGNQNTVNNDPGYGSLNVTGNVGIGTWTMTNDLIMPRGGNVGIGTSTANDALHEINYNGTGGITLDSEVGQTASMGDSTDNDAPGEYLGTEGGIVQWLGNTFQLNSPALVSSISFNFDANGGTPTGTVAVSIQTPGILPGSSGRPIVTSLGVGANSSVCTIVPSGNLAAPNATVNITPITSSTNTATFSTPVYLPAGMYIVTEIPNTVQTNGNYWQIDDDTASTFNGTEAFYFGGGGNLGVGWSSGQIAGCGTTSPSYVQNFQINFSTPTPNSRILLQNGGVNKSVINATNIGIGTTNFSAALSVMSGNVGIGTPTPGGSLDVGGGEICLGHVCDSAWPSGGGGSNYWNLTSGNTGIDTFFPVGIGTTFTTTSALTVTSGNVGIGTWIPAASLDVEGNSPTAIFGSNIGIGTSVMAAPLNILTPSGNTVLLANDFASNGLFRINRYQGSKTSPSAVGGTEILAGLQWGGYNGTSSQIGAEIESNVANTTWTGSTNPATLSFLNSNGTALNINQYIDSAGNVGFESGVTAGSTALGNKLEVGGQEAIGADYVTTGGTPITAPTNGLFVEGNVGIATTLNSGQLTVGSSSGIGAAVVDDEGSADAINLSGGLQVLDIVDGFKTIQSASSIDSYTIANVGTDLFLQGNSQYSIYMDGITEFGASSNNDHWSYPASVMVNAVNGTFNTGENAFETFSNTSNSAPVFVISSKGNVGIGTWTPNALNTGGRLLVTGGNVGFGTVTPGQILDIQGNARTTGFILSNNGAASGNVLVTNNIGVGTWMVPSTLNNWGGQAEQTISYQPGLLSAVNSTVGVYGKFQKSSTVDNLICSAVTFSCVSNPTITEYECGTSTTCSSPTTISSETVTSSGTAFSGSISSSAITAGDFVGFAMTAGTCASIDIACTSQVHSN